MGGCCNCGPFLGTLTIRCLIKNGDSKRDHNFDKHPYRDAKGLYLSVCSTVTKGDQADLALHVFPQDHHFP